MSVEQGGSPLLETAEHPASKDTQLIQDVICQIKQVEFETESETSYPQRRVIVHVTFLKIGEISTLKECFEADILLRTKWREPDLDTATDTDDLDFGKFWSPKIFIDDVIGGANITTHMALERASSGLAYLVERRRIRGSFIEKLELADFPFDVQDLSITIMSDWPASEVELVEDPNEIHKIYKLNFIDEQEWYLYKYIESTKRELLKDQADPHATRSALTVMARAARRPGYYIWNVFSVTMLIASLSFVTFAVKHDLPQNRLQLSFTLVLTAVAFKFVVNQCLPRVSYLTYLDKYVLCSMIEVSAVCFWHGIQTKLDISESKDYIAMTTILGLYMLYNIQFFIRILLGPCKKRRLMKRKENEYVETVKNQSKKKTSWPPSPRQRWRQLRKRKEETSSTPERV